MAGAMPVGKGFAIFDKTAYFIGSLKIPAASLRFPQTIGDSRLMERYLRIRHLLVSPRQTWQTIAEAHTSGVETLGWVALPLLVLSRFAEALGLSVFKQNDPLLGAVKMPWSSSLAEAGMAVVATVLILLAGAFLIQWVAPFFSGKRNFSNALCLVVYAYSPRWIMGVLALFPALNLVSGFIGWVFMVYLLWMGLPILMEHPMAQNKVYLLVCVLLLGGLQFLLETLGVGALMVAFGLDAADWSQTL